MLESQTTRLTREQAPQPSLRPAILGALTLILGSILVVWTVRIDERFGSRVVQAGTGQGQVTPQEVEHLKAEVGSIRDSIEQTLAKLGTGDGVLRPTDPNGYLYQALFSTETTLDLILKMESAVQRGKDFVARHYRKEMQREYEALCAYLDRAKEALTDP